MSPDSNCVEESLLLNPFGGTLCAFLLVGGERQRFGIAALRTGSEAAVMAKKMSTIVQFSRVEYAPGIEWVS